MNKAKKICGILLTAVLLLAGCGSGDKTEGDRTVREVNRSIKEVAQTTTVKIQDVKDASFYDGQVFYKTTQLSFPKEGTFETFKVELGDSVKKGQVLATTQSSVSEKEYEKLKNSADRIKENYQFDSAIKNLELEKLKLELQVIYMELEETDPSSPFFTSVCRKAGVKYREIESKELEIKQLNETYDFEYPYYNNKVKAYKATMGKNNIVAPFDGTVVSMINTQSGAYVDSDSYVIALSETNTLCIYTDYMTENYVNGMVEVYALIDGRKYAVEYTELDKDLYLKLKAADAKMYGVFTILDAGEDVVPGDAAKLVLVKRKAENAVAVPRNAVQVDTVGRFVYVEENGNKEKRYVTIGISDGAYYEILDGLTGGEVIHVGK